MYKRWCIILCLSCCSRIAAAQSALQELERQLDSLLRKQQKSEVVISVAFGNNPAYGNRTLDFELPIIMKNFLSPSVSYYHRSGVFGTVSTYYMLNSDRTPWFEWDFTAGYDYTKHPNILTGISYTKYIFADSSDVPSTPIHNELFAYFYYRKWWVQPGISIDYGWGRQSELAGNLKRMVSGNDLNVILAARHPFVFIDLLTTDDAMLLTPSVGFTMGTANYFSNLKGFQYMARSPKIKNDNNHKNRKKKNNWGEVFETEEERTGFEPRAIDVTLHLSYMIGKFTLTPSYTVFKPLQGEDKNIMSYFTARVTLNL